VLHMHRISLGIVGFEQKGGEAVKLRTVNCIVILCMNEGVMAGEGR
jgi:hypothetical protein